MRPIIATLLEKIHYAAKNLITYRSGILVTGMMEEYFKEIADWVLQPVWKISLTRWR